MGAARETMSIFRELKNKDFRRAWWLIKMYRKDRNVHEDTWMPLVCKIRVHKAYQPDKEYEPEEWACKRCHRFLPDQRVREI